VCLCSVFFDAFVLSFKLCVLDADLVVFGRLGFVVRKYGDWSPAWDSMQGSRYAIFLLFIVSPLGILIP